MNLGLLSWHFHSNGKHLLTARIKSQDGAQFRAQLADVRLAFKTALGRTEIPLSHIHKLENVAHLDTLRDVAKLHRFRIFCTDGNELIGVPLSPDRLPVAIDEDDRMWHYLRLIEIVSLEILPRESFSVPEHALN